MERFSEREEALWQEALAGRTPEEILRWAHATFGERLALACSFGGVTGMALLDMATRAVPDLCVFTIDTGFLFPETIATREAAAVRYGLTPLVFRPKLTPEEQAARHGEALWKRDPDACCALRKVEPNARALAGRDAWIAGLRRDQSKTREEVAPVSWDENFGLYKVAPLYAWTEEDVWAYVRAHDVPVNPLHEQGYASIGCTHCTRATEGGEDLRAGRWDWSAKTECGLHARATR